MIRPAKKSVYRNINTNVAVFVISLISGNMHESSASAARVFRHKAPLSLADTGAPPTSLADLARTQCSPFIATHATLTQPKILVTSVILEVEEMRNMIQETQLQHLRLISLFPILQKNPALHQLALKAVLDIKEWLEKADPELARPGIKATTENNEETLQNYIAAQAHIVAFLNEAKEDYPSLLWPPRRPPSPDRMIIRSN
ncbi:MAG: hypothetical protein LBJ77_02210 [Holosporales bacterium]|jgi:hypothetical protein|nr:hypothetical protein [Holosporales bacterium]